MSAHSDDWGSPGPLGADGVVVDSDHDLRAVVEGARQAGAELPEVGLLGGDLWRTVGGRADEARLRGAAAVRLEIDVGSVLLDGRRRWFVSHLLVRRPLWIGWTTALMNAAWCGSLHLGPRAHPGDGLLDVSEGTIPARQLREARRRARVGDHLPHPGVSSRRVPAWSVELDRPREIRLDHDRVGRARSISVELEPGALTVVV